MESRTKARVSEEQIHHIIRYVLGWEKPVRRLTALNGGCFNLSYRVDFEDEESIIIKIGPPEEVEVLSYEKDMMETELWIHNLIEKNPAVSVPKILYTDFSRKDIPYPYFIMTALQGSPMNELNDLSEQEKRNIFLTLAGYMAEIHRIKGDHFGYALMRDHLQNRSYFEAFTHMVEVILSDGKKRKVTLPASEERIFQSIYKFQDVFSTCSVPVLNHFDLWEGNLFIKETEEGQRQLEAIIDFERGFYADPAADFVQVRGAIDFETESWFLEEYNRVADTPFIYNKNAKIRIDLYWLYLCLIMVVESYYRDVEGSFDDQKKWAEQEVLKVLNSLESLDVPGIS